MEPFNYQALNRDETEFRLLTYTPQLLVKTGLENTFQTLSLRHISLNEKPDYIALSYVWGQQCPQAPLQLYDTASDLSEVVGVTQNLAGLLPELVEFASGRSVWIDALCINQADDEEKSWQVALLQRIYQQAASVFVWLGPDADEGSSTLIKLDAVGSQAHVEPVLMKWQFMYWYNVTHDESPSEDMLGKLVGQSTHSTIESLLRKYPVSDSASAMIPLTSTQKLLQRQWWQRVWVFQEIILPGIDCGLMERRSRNEQIIFGCGKARSNLNHIAAAMTILRLYLTASAGGLYGSGQRMVVPELDARSFLMLSAQMWTERVSLLRLLQSTSAHTGNENRLAATDPRDRVYSLLSISSDAHQLEIYPDYTKNCQEIYTNTAAALIRQHGPDIMLLAYTPKILKDIPSWAPDWSAESIGYTISLPQGTTEHRFNKFLHVVSPPFKPWAAGEQLKSSIDFAERNSVLNVKGQKIADVAQVIDPGVWLHFRTTAAALLENRQSVGRPHAIFSTSYKPPATAEEAQQHRVANDRRSVRPLISKGLTASAKIDPNRSSTSDPFLDAPFDDDDPVLDALKTNPAVEFEWVDGKNFQAYLTCIHDLQIELRKMCLAQNSTYDENTLANALWRAPTADQGVKGDIRDWSRPSEQARAGILFYQVMHESAFNIKVGSWPEWVRDTWLEWVQSIWIRLGIFVEEPTMADMRFMCINPNNEPRVAIIGYPGGRYALGYKRYEGDGKPEGALCSIMYKPIDELAVLFHESGTLQDEKYENREKVICGLAEGIIKLEDIIGAIQAEVNNAIRLDESQLIGLMVSTIRYLREVVLQAVGRTIFVTSQGYLGLGPMAIQTGDEIVSLAGSNGLFVLRPSTMNRHHFVGESYVYGAMDGELADQRQDAQEPPYVEYHIA